MAQFIEKTVAPKFRDTKICTGCSEEKPEASFKMRSGRQAGQRASMCHRCLYVKYTRPHAGRKTSAVQAYKVSHGCADCGYSAHPAALQFDHLPGTEKLFNVMEKVGCYSIERIWTEIAKCDVVCANCHAIRTATRRDEVAV